MTAQSTDSDIENPSDENGSTAYAELLAASSLEELEEKPWEVKLALLQHHLELARIFVGELLKEEVEERAGERSRPRQASRRALQPVGHQSRKRPDRRGEGADRRASYEGH